MERRSLATELVLAAAGCFIGTKLMERLSMALYARESEPARRREEAVRPEPPFRIAAEKSLQAAGISACPEVIEVGLLRGPGVRWETPLGS